MARMRFLNAKIDNVTMDEACSIVTDLAQNSSKSYVVTPNVNHIVLLEEDEEFRKIYDNASLVLTDGKPLIWISRWLKTPIKEKVSGSDLFPRVCAKAVSSSLSVFLFGAGEGVADIAAERLKEKYKGLNIVGTYSPEFGFENNPEQLSKAIDAINKCNPDILVIGLGAPKQEKFIYNNRDRINFNVALCIGVTIDFEAGVQKRAPHFISEMGLEWFHRFIHNPGKLFKRYFIEGPRIIPIVFKYRKVMKEIRNEEQK